jgi:hypothetical protein
VGRQVLGSETARDDFYDAWFGYLDRADTCTVLAIWLFQGSVPISGKYFGFRMPEEAADGTWSSKRSGNCSASGSLAFVLKTS